MKKLVLVSLSLFLLTACASKLSGGFGSTGIMTLTDPFAGKAEEDAFLRKNGFSKRTSDADKLLREGRLKKIEGALKDVLSTCRSILLKLEAKSERRAKRAYWLSMSGLVAGTVVAPWLLTANSAANAASVAAFSGWAGATNFAKESLVTSGLSGAASSSRRNMIVKDVGDGIKEAISAFSSDDDPTGSAGFVKARLALFKAQAGCILYEIAVPTLGDVPTP